MNDNLGDINDLRQFEQALRETLHQEAESINPNSRLNEILAHEPVVKGAKGFWFLGAAAAFVLVAALGVGYLVVTRQIGSTNVGGAVPAQTTTSSPDATRTPVETPTASSSSSSPATETKTWSMPVYEVVSGTSVKPWLLSRTFVTVADPGDRSARVQAAIAAFLSQKTSDGKQLAGYNLQNPWLTGTTAKVTVTDSSIGIVLNQAGMTGLTGEQQRIAVQGLVWTATAAAQLNVPVRVEVAGAAGAFETLPAADYVRPASDESYADLVPIWIDSPTAGTGATSPLTVTGQACVFEAQFSWELMQGSTVVKSGTAKATSGCPTSGSYAIPLGALTAGTYTIRLYEISAEDGSVFYETKQTITIS